MSSSQYSALISTFNACELFFAFTNSPIYVTITCLSPLTSLKKLSHYLKTSNAFTKQQFKQQLTMFLMHSNAYFQASLCSFQRTRIDNYVGDDLTKTSTLSMKSSENPLSLYGSINCLLQLLLQIPSLQGDLLLLIIEKIIMFGTEYSEVEMPRIGHVLPVEIAQLINLIRWQNEIANPREMITLLIDSLASIPVWLRVELIGLLPLLIGDNIIISTHNNSNKTNIGNDNVSGNDPRIDEDEKNGVYDNADGLLFVINSLLTEMQNTPALIPCILDCLGNLSLSPTSVIMHVIRVQCLKLLAIAEEQHMPMIVKFLLEWSNLSNVAIDDGNFNDDTLPTIIDEESREARIDKKGIHAMYAYLRVQLHNFLKFAMDSVPLIEANLEDESQEAVPSSSLSDMNHRRELQSMLSVLLNVMKSVFQSRPILISVLFSCITIKPNAGDDPLHDGDAAETNVLGVFELELWLIFALYGNAAMRQKLLTGLIHLCQWTASSAAPTSGSDAPRKLHDVILSSIHNHGVILEPYVDDILCLAQACLAHTRVVAAAVAKSFRRIGADIMLALYDEFPSVLRRQELVAALVRYGASFPTSTGVAAIAHRAICQSAIDCLATLSNKEWKQCWALGRPASAIGDLQRNSKPTLRTFAPFLKSLLEDIHRYSDIQIRTVFDIVFQTTILTRTISSSTGTGSSSSSAAGTRIHVTIVSPDDVLILLKKYSTHADKRKLKTAVIGYASYLLQMLLVCHAVEESYRRIDSAQLTIECDQQAATIYMRNTAMHRPGAQSNQSQQNIPLQILLFVLSTTLDASEKKAIFLLEIATTIRHAFTSGSLALGDDAHILTVVENAGYLAITQTQRSRSSAVSSSPAESGPVSSKTAIEFLVKLCSSLESGLQSVMASTLEDAYESQTTTKQWSRRLSSASSNESSSVLTSSCLYATKLEKFQDLNCFTGDDPGVMSAVLFVRAAMNALEQGTRSVLNVASSLNENWFGKPEFGRYHLSLCFLLRHYLKQSIADTIILLEAALELPSIDVLVSIEDLAPPAALAACISIYYAVDWLRSLVNCFTENMVSYSETHDLDSLQFPGSALRALLVARLNLAVRLEKQLVSLVQRVPSFLTWLQTNSGNSNVSDSALSQWNGTNGVNATVGTKRAKVNTGSKGTTVRGSKGKGKGRGNPGDSLDASNLEISQGLDESTLDATTQISVLPTGSKSSINVTDHGRVNCDFIQSCLQESLSGLRTDAIALLVVGYDPCDETESSSGLPINEKLCHSATLRLLTIMKLGTQSILHNAFLPGINDVEKSYGIRLLKEISTSLMCCRQAMLDWIVGGRNLLELTKDVMETSAELTVSSDDNDVEIILRSSQLQSRELDCTAKLNRVLLYMQEMLPVMRALISNEHLRDELVKGLSGDQQAVTSILLTLLRAFVVEDHDAEAPATTEEQKLSGFTKYWQGSVDLMVEFGKSLPAVLPLLGSDHSTLVIDWSSLLASLISLVIYIADSSTKPDDTATKILHETLSDCKDQAVSLCDELLRSSKWSRNIESQSSITKPTHAVLSMRALDFILKMRLEFASNKLDVLEDLVAEAFDPFLRKVYNAEMKDCRQPMKKGNRSKSQPDAPDSDDDLDEDIKTVYATLTMVSFPTYYHTCFDSLLSDFHTALTRFDSIVSKPVAGAAKQRRIAQIVDDNDETRVTVDDIADSVHRCVDLAFNLLAVTKLESFEKRSILTTALKCSGRFVSVFLKSGKKLLTYLFKRDAYRKKVITIIKSIQKSTRQMQYLCAHGKLIRDAQLSKEVPAIKRNLEHIIYFVREMLQQHSLDASVGVLKHKALDGTEIKAAQLEDKDFVKELKDTSKEATSSSAAAKSKKATKPTKPAKPAKAVETKRVSKRQIISQEEDEEDAENEEDEEDNVGDIRFASKTHDVDDDEEEVEDEDDEEDEEDDDVETLVDEDEEYSDDDDADEYGKRRIDDYSDLKTFIAPDDEEEEENELEHSNLQFYTESDEDTTVRKRSQRNRLTKGKSPAHRDMDALFDEEATFTTKAKLFKKQAFASERSNTKRKGKDNTLERNTRRRVLTDDDSFGDEFDTDEDLNDNVDILGNANNLLTNPKIGNGFFVDCEEDDEDDEEEIVAFRTRVRPDSLLPGQSIDY